MSRQLARCWGVAPRRRGNHANGAETRRPSTSVTISSSSVHLTSTASATGLLTRDNHFRAIAKSAQKFFTVLPTQSELGDIGEAESANNVSEKIDIRFIEVRAHHRALSPIDQFRLAQLTVQVVGNLIDNG